MAVFQMILQVIQETNYRTKYCRNACILSLW